VYANFVVVGSILSLLVLCWFFYYLNFLSPLFFKAAQYLFSTISVFLFLFNFFYYLSFYSSVFLVYLIFFGGFPIFLFNLLLLSSIFLMFYSFFLILLPPFYVILLLLSSISFPFDVRFFASFSKKWFSGLLGLFLFFLFCFLFVAYESFYSSLRVVSWVLPVNGSLAESFLVLAAPDSPVGVLEFVRGMNEWVASSTTTIITLADSSFQFSNSSFSVWQMVGDINLTRTYWPYNNSWTLSASNSPSPLPPASSFVPHSDSYWLIGAPVSIFFLFLFLSYFGF